MSAFFQYFEILVKIKFLTKNIGNYFILFSLLTKYLSLKSEVVSENSLLFLNIFLFALDKKKLKFLIIYKYVSFINPLCQIEFKLSRLINPRSR